MKPLFYIGLSCISSVLAQTGAEGRKRRSAEGLRILSLLDALPADPKEASLKRPIAYEPGGRPYFPDFHADFSISHSRNMVATAIQISNEQLAMSNEKPPPSSFPEGRIGCDIQYCNPGKSCVEISRRFFHADEQAYIENAGTEQVRNFYRIWVLKEAWLKLHGFSVFDMIKAPVFSIGGDPQTVTDEGGLVYFLYELSSPNFQEPYMLAAARQLPHSFGGETEPEIRWFSDTAFALNRVENIYAAQSPENTVIPNM
jgi:phosphopantetheinyl transferase